MSVWNETCIPNYALRVSVGLDTNKLIADKAGVCYEEGMEVDGTWESNWN